MHRRHFLAGSLAGLASYSWPKWAIGKKNGLFPLGVASGDMTSGSTVLWTRLVADPMQDKGGLGETDYKVAWELARDPKMKDVVQRGEANASHMLGHSVHVDVQGLLPGTEYWYRFYSEGEVSTIGRTRTLPVGNVPSMRFVTTSCQNYTHGYFVAYKHILEDDPDFVVHLGDYIYDTSFGETFRRHDREEAPRSLEDFRRRHALYKTDRYLQAAHARLPFFTVIDNHDAIEDNSPEQYDLRAAAYQAWYEHMPVRGYRLGSPNEFHLARLINVGDLLQINMLDTRQFRDKRDLCLDNLDKAVGFGNYRERCGALLEEGRTMLGQAQEKALYQSIRENRAQWNVIASSGPVLPYRVDVGGEDFGYIGSWDAYPANRRRLAQAIQDADAGHALILSGDLHSFWAMDGHKVTDAADKVPAEEFVSSSISANWPQPLSEPIAQNLAKNPHVSYYDGTKRGYLLHDVTATSWRVRCRAVGDATRHDAKVEDTKVFEVIQGQQGIIER